MSALTPADELRTAAAKLRAAGGGATEGPWQMDGPYWWREDDCTHAITDMRHRRSVAVMPPRATDTGRRDENAAWIALVHPGLAEPLAVWLEASADDMDEHGAVEGSMSKKVHGVSLTFGILLAPRPDWTAALRTARLINGGAQ